MACFKRAHQYISGFLPVRSALVVGNHDLEGEDFETDEENLAAWRQVCLILRFFCMQRGINVSVQAHVRPSSRILFVGEAVLPLLESQLRCE